VALHKHSPRANGPFVGDHTAAIPKTCWKASCSAMSAAPFHRGPDRCRRDASSSRGRHPFLDEIAHAGSTSDPAAGVLSDGTITVWGATARSGQCAG